MAEISTFYDNGLEKLALIDAENLNIIFIYNGL